jgi:hypothetical protein
MGDVLCKQVKKGHVMHKISRKRSPLELADLILMHNAGASMEMIANVISEWGGLFDEHRYGNGESIDIERPLPHGEPQSGSLNSEFTQPLKRLDG